MTVHVEDDKLLLFVEKSSSQIEPKEQIPFSTIVNVDDDINYGGHFTLENISDTEKRCIFRVRSLLFLFLFKIIIMLEKKS